MVAAWISADTGSEAGHRVREPGEQRDLGALAGAGEEQQQRRHGRDAAGQRRVRREVGGVEHPVVVQAADLPVDREHREQEADVADAVAMKAFFAAGGAETS